MSWAISNIFRLSTGKGEGGKASTADWMFLLPGRFSGSPSVEPRVPERLPWEVVLSPPLLTTPFLLTYLEVPKFPVWLEAVISR